MSIWKDKEGRLHVAVQRNGRRVHRRMPKGASKSDAKLVEAELTRSSTRKVPGIPGNPQLCEIMALYLRHAETLRSPESARYHALRCGPWAEGHRASDAHIVADRMIEDMRQAYCPATINRTLGTMKKALTIAWRQHLIPENYGARITRLPENNQRNEYLTLEQVAALANAGSKTVRAAVWIALLTGCRRGEILKLRPDDVRGSYLRIVAGNTKTLRERAIPIVPALRPWLAFLPLPITADGLKAGFARARKKIGSTAHFHDLRHSCASLLVNMGTPLEVVRDILGHTTVKTTERYAHLLIDRQAEALEKLSQAVAEMR